MAFHKREMAIKRNGHRRQLKYQRDHLIGARLTVFYAETRPPVLWTGKTKCGRVLICVDGSGRVKKKNLFLFLCITVSSA